MAKKINPSILEHNQKSYSLEELAKENRKLNETEIKIIKSRLKGQPFYELSPDDVRLATDRIMFRGAAISGCTLPTTEGFAEIISSELALFINEFGYSSLTLSEIILALHLNVSGTLKYPSGDSIDKVEFTGNCFNVAYMAKVLSNYRIVRNHLDRKFENQIDGHE